MKSRLPFNTWLYFLAQSINLTTAVMSVSMAAWVGAAIAPAPWLATVPYGFQFLFVMLTTYPASKLMAAMGRKKSFLLATVPLAASGIAGFLAVQQNVFLLLVVSHSLLGTYIAFANFNRFAATDGVAAYLKPRIISLVVAGGVLAAILGPLLTTSLKDVGTWRAFSACYAAFVVLALISFLINLLIKENARPAVPAHESSNQNTDLRLVFKNKTVLLAVAVAATGYAIMNLLMIQSSMHMAHMHVHFAAVSTAIQWHVLAMFAPSFITGYIIQKIGLRTVIFIGILLLLSSGSINILGTSYHALTAALIALGLGWNFTYVGASALLTLGLEGIPNAVKFQGINDLGVAIAATLGAFAPAFLLSGLGWLGTNILCIGIGLILLAFSMAILKGKNLPN